GGEDDHRGQDDLQQGRHEVPLASITRIRQDSFLLADPADIQTEVASLDAAWRAGDPADGELRKRVEERLEALRGLWRRRAELFSTEDLRSLKALGQTMGPPAATGAPPRGAHG